MYDRIVTGKFKPESLDEATKIMRESVIPSQKERQGWKGTKILLDREKSMVTTIVSWATKEDAISVAKEGFIENQMKKIKPFLADEPTIELCEVIINESI
jgi:hypothetical protein